MHCRLYQRCSDLTQELPAAPCSCTWQSAAGDLLRVLQGPSVVASLLAQSEEASAPQSAALWALGSCLNHLESIMQDRHVPAVPSCCSEESYACLPAGGDFRTPVCRAVGAGQLSEPPAVHHAGQVRCTLIVQRPDLLPGSPVCLLAVYKEDPKLQSATMSALGSCLSHLESNMQDRHAARCVCSVQYPDLLLGRHMCLLAPRMKTAFGHAMGAGQLPERLAVHHAGQAWPLLGTDSIHLDARC